MRILFSSHLFFPSIGGIEQVGLTLATEFARVNHEVKLVTSTPGPKRPCFSFEIIRSPSPSALLELVHWCQVFFHNNISLRVAWPLLFVRRPWVITHHQWISRPDNSVAIRDRLKQWTLRFATNIAVSPAIADHLVAPSVVIENPYRDDLFRREEGISRNKDLIFVGRLVPDKGVDLLLDALHHLRQQQLRPNLTIIGDGPSDGRLREQAARLRLSDQVEFLGARTGIELAEELNRHRVIVVPSRFEEPFGLVAIEGAACGCRAVLAASGGLRGVLGELAIRFEKGNYLSLAEAIRKALIAPFDWESYWSSIDEYLRRYEPKHIARRYLEILEKAAG